jgi:hypothetical protein
VDRLLRDARGLSHRAALPGEDEGDLLVLADDDALEVRQQAARRLVRWIWIVQRLLPRRLSHRATTV